MKHKILIMEHSYFEIKQIMTGLLSKYPFLGIKYLGKSCAGRDILSLSIGSTENPVVFLGGDDPTYRLSTLIILLFCEELCKAVQDGEEMCGLNIRKALFGRGIIFLPLLNPDGAEIALRGEMGCGYMSGKISRLCNGKFENWRSNLRGVEICRNFSYNFEKREQEQKQNRTAGPATEGFCGYRSESEPETLALTELCRTQNVRHLIHLRAPGNTVCYSGDPTPLHSEKMAEVISAVSGLSITPPIGEGGNIITDWFAEEFSKPAICIKLGKDHIPKISEAAMWYGRLKEALTLSALF